MFCQKSPYLLPAEKWCLCRVGESKAMLSYAAPFILFERLMFILSLCCSVMVCAVLPQQSNFSQCLSLSPQLVLLLGNRSWRKLLNYENKPLPQISPQFSSLSLTWGFCSMFELSVISQVSCDLNRRSQLSGVMLAGIPCFFICLTAVPAGQSKDCAGRTWIVSSCPSSLYR